MANQEMNPQTNPPRHWVDLEELNPGYWTDSKALELRGQEFLEKPIEALSAIENTPEFGATRRDFLTVMGASMAMATMACARRPVNKIIPYVVKPLEVQPGIANWYASTCKDLPDAPAILIKNREGRPIKLEGNDLESMTGGAISAQAQASLLGLYDVDRLKNTILLNRKPGSETVLDAAAADAKVVEALKAKQATGRVRVLTSAFWGPSTSKVVKEFLGGFKNGSVVHAEPLGDEAQLDAAEAAFGRAAPFAYRWDSAETILSIGGDFLGADVGSEANARAWSKKRKLNSEKSAHADLSKLIVFESTMTITGANADERYAIRPGDEYAVAMAIAYELILTRKATLLAGDASVRKALESFKPETVAADIGGTFSVEMIKKAAAAVAASGGKSIVVAGGGAHSDRTSTGLQLAAALMNAALGNYGKTVGFAESTRERRGGAKALAKLIAEMKAGTVDVLFIHRSNPAYWAAPAMGWAEALAKVPYVFVVGDRVDETAIGGDLVFGEHHYLENWGDADQGGGAWSLQQPALHPLHDTRGFEDLLLSWMTGMGRKSATWHDSLRDSWKQSVYPKFGAGKSFEGFWEDSLQKGIVGRKAEISLTGGAFKSSSLTQAPAFKPAGTGIRFGAYVQSQIGDGRFANNAWLLELPDPITTITWDNFLNVAPALATQMGLKLGDKVRLTLGDQSLDLPVYIQPGMHPSAVTAAVGWGRTRAGQVATGAGWNVFPLAKVEDGVWTTTGLAASVKKLGSRFELAMTQGHHRSENRPVINDITLAEFRRNPKSANHTDPHLRMENPPTMWSTFKYEGYKWGMAIDLNACTGCGACVIACQAENNIPTVGRQLVRMSREMHWIRIDRYFNGTAENPDVVFQPMLCQHCDNAPCETVCPVIATVHNEEGLNQMVYNRCVGTRYCQNNCSYKVRRFNFFDHWKDYKDTMNLVWNPDVTVRSRGVMEKCTFCVQRIQSARDLTKSKGAKISDADLKTACQQTCPTEAIVFGDVNNPASAVAKLKDDARAYRVLEVLNTKPAISYLSKVRNKEEGAAHGEHHS